MFVEDAHVSQPDRAGGRPRAVHHVGMALVRPRIQEHPPDPVVHGIVRHDVGVRFRAMQETDKQLVGDLGLRERPVPYANIIHLPLEILGRPRTRTFPEIQVADRVSRIGIRHASHRTIYKKRPLFRRVVIGQGHMGPVCPIGRAKLNGQRGNKGNSRSINPSFHRSAGQHQHFKTARCIGVVFIHEKQSLSGLLVLATEIRLHGEGAIQLVGHPRAQIGRGTVERQRHGGRQRRHLDADRPRTGRQVELGFVPEDGMHGDEPHVVVAVVVRPLQLQQGIAIRARIEDIVAAEDGMAVGLLERHQRGRVGRGHRQRQPRVDSVGAGEVPAHVGRGVRRPIALVVQDLERPARAHEVLLPPNHLHHPRLPHRLADRIQRPVLGAVAVVALVLIDIAPDIVVARQPRGHQAVQPRRIVAVARRFELPSNIPGHRPLFGRAHLDHDRPQQIPIQPRVVVGHHHLALDLPPGLQPVRRGVQEQPPDHVGVDLRHAAGIVRGDPVPPLGEVGVAEELHEMPGQIHRRAVVGFVRPEDAIGLRARHPAHHIGVREHRVRLDGVREDVPDDLDHPAAGKGNARQGRLIEDRVVRIGRGIGQGRDRGAPIHVGRRDHPVAQIVLRLDVLERGSDRGLLQLELGRPRDIRRERPGMARIVGLRRSSRAPHHRNPVRCRPGRRGGGVEDRKIPGRRQAVPGIFARFA